MKRGGELRIGISGWCYSGWRGKFYPRSLPQRRELEYAGCVLNSVEINGSFYSLQLPSSYERWYSATPDDFVFAIKGPRFITHMKKLRDVKVPLANFFASGLLALREKLGPILCSSRQTSVGIKRAWKNFLNCCRAIRAARRSLPRSTMTS
jgi:uncharacterized protein YecE (DUF72 family)